MSSFKLALFNVRNNIKLFKFNIISMVVSIAVFFDFFTLIFNPSLNFIGSDHMLINVTMYMASLLLLFFITFFVLYSNSFFLKQRKREIGIYTFMGVDSSKIGIVYAIEQLILGLLSLVSGIFFGLIFQKAFLMFLNKISGFVNPVTFYLSDKAIIATSLVFFFIFIIAGLKGYTSISKSKLIDLMNAEKHEERLLKSRYITGILSIILILIGCYYSRDVFNEDFVLNCSIVMICIIPGIFLLFNSFLSMIINSMVKNKKILYNGTNIISISNIAYRIKYNYKTLAIISIIATATIIATSSCLSIQHIFTTITDVASPYSFSYCGDAKVTEKVLETIDSSDHEVLLNVKANYLIFNANYGTEYKKNHPVIKLSDYIQIISSLDISDKTVLINNAKKLKDGVAISVSSLNDSGFGDNETIDMYGLPIKVAKAVDVPLLSSRFEYNTLVITDDDYNRFKDICLNLANPVTEDIFNGIIVSNQNQSLELSERLLSIPKLKNNLNSFINYYNSYYGMTGVAKFTGLFLGLVFMLTTGSIMFMKIIGDAFGDKKKYEILIKLGLTNKELNRAISKQVGLSYILPLIVGIAFAYVGIEALSGFLNRFFTISLLKPFSISLALYCIIYLFFYILTTKKFINMVTS